MSTDLLNACVRRSDDGARYAHEALEERDHVNLRGRSPLDLQAIQDSDNHRHERLKIRVLADLARQLLVQQAAQDPPRTRS